MRRPLAFLATVLSLAALPARAGEPLDLDLYRLGNPAAAGAAGQASRIRFAKLATSLALGMSSPLLEPASTTGANGWDLAAEEAYTPVTSSAADAAWPTRSAQPSSLVTTSLHLRKAFPYSIEVGGRLTYLSRSQLYASQLSLKWAFLEGYDLLPDLAVRLAYTRLDGQRDLAVAATELDLLASHRFGVNAVVSLTPYLGLRFSRMHANTPALRWSDPVGGDPSSGTAAFPTVDSTLFRTTLGCRMTAYAVSLAAELSVFGGVSDKAGADASYKVPSSVAAAGRIGFEF